MVDRLVNFNLGVFSDGARRESDGRAVFSKEALFVRSEFKFLLLFPEIWLAPVHEKLAILFTAAGFLSCPDLKTSGI